MEKCTSTRVRRKALREEIFLEDLLKYGRTMETSDRQIAQFESLEQSGIQVNNLDAPKSCFFVVAIFPIHKEERLALPQGKHAVIVENWVISLKSAKRNLVRHEIFQSLEHHGKLQILKVLATSHGILLTQWMPLIPAFPKQVYRLVTVMTMNSSSLWKGQPHHHTRNSQLPRSQ